VLARQAQTLGISEQDAERRLAEGNLLRRLITAQEIAYVVAFLASPKAVAINGDVIAAGGGAPRSIHY
jgi:NAD(P)-dependent dehydrogenase (short-subunit alcohol dehydrogenase family)